MGSEFFGLGDVPAGPVEPGGLVAVTMEGSEVEARMSCAAALGAKRQ